MDTTKEPIDHANLNLTTSTAAAVDAVPQPPPTAAVPIAYRSPAWLDALEAQLTPAMLRQACSTARAQLGILARLGLDPGCDGEDLVHQLVEAILAGTVRWESTVPLGAFLHNKLVDLGRRLRRGRRLSIAAAMVLLDHCDEDDSVWTESAVHSNGDAVGAVELRHLARRAEAELVKLAARDPDALRLLAAMPDATNDAEIAEATGLSRAAVAAAKKRVRRYAEWASPRLRADVRAVVGGGRRAGRDTTGRSRDHE